MQVSTLTPFAKRLLNILDECGYVNWDGQQFCDCEWSRLSNDIEDRTRVKIKPGRLRDYFDRRRVPDLDELIAIADGLEVCVRYLCYDSPPKRGKAPRSLEEILGQ